VKITTNWTTQTSTGLYSVLDPHCPPSGTWAALAKDVYLSDGTVRVAGNPHAVVQCGNTLAIIEYDTQKIWFLGTTELDGLIDPQADHVLAQPSIDLGIDSDAALPSTAKGQDLAYIKNGNNEYLFALFQVPGTSGGGYNPSILVRLKKNSSGVFVYEKKTNVGMNAMSIVPVTGLLAGTSAPDTYLLVPAYGGEQQGGATNQDNSNITIVPAFAAAANFVASVLLTGTPYTAPADPTTFDIAAVAAQAPLETNPGNSKLYILTYSYANSSYSALNWKRYKTTVDELLSVYNPSASPTLASLEGTVLKIKDQGPTGGIGGYGGLTYWDMLYENGKTPHGDRLWFRRDGIEIINVHPASESDESGEPKECCCEPCEPDVVVFEPGLELGETGNININSFDLVAETIRQAEAGLSLKRGFKRHLAHARAIAAAVAAAEEESRK
jgi:hypothetical protein